MCVCVCACEKTADTAVPLLFHLRWLFFLAHGCFPEIFVKRLFLGLCDLTHFVRHQWKIVAAASGFILTHQQEQITVVRIIRWRDCKCKVMVQLYLVFNEIRFSELWWAAAWGIYFFLTLVLYCFLYLLPCSHLEDMLMQIIGGKLASLERKVWICYVW